MKHVNEIKLDCSFKCAEKIAWDYTRFVFKENQIEGSIICFLG